MPDISESVNHWHAEVRENIRHTDRTVCAVTSPEDKYPALRRAKDWLANEMAEDFKRYAGDPNVRERMLAVADDHRAYDGHGRGWEGWFVAPDAGGGMLIHYRLTPPEDPCEREAP
jgi:hypothetical protein